jgi:DDE superfamily endonuclease
MSPLPEAIITVLGAFTPLFSHPVGRHAQVLLIGAILCQGPRTVTAALRVLGLTQERRFEKYHRVLSRAPLRYLRRSGLQGAKILLGLLIPLLPSSWPIVVGVDETLERRQGRKIQAKGCYRDAVRSTHQVVVKCYGLKWVSLMLLRYRSMVPLPWSSRPWALPFLTVLAPSQRANEAVGKRHKTTIDWTVQRVKGVGRWLGQRPWVLIGDGGFACVRLALVCLQARCPVTLVSRLRLDAQLYDFPAPRSPLRYLRPSGAKTQEGAQEAQGVEGPR